MSNINSKSAIILHSDDTKYLIQYDNTDDFIKSSCASIQLYYYTKKYCVEYNVPETIAFNILKLETSYNGPDDIMYNPIRTSIGNAYGPYQLLLSTARDMYDGNDDELTRERLLYDIELNTKLGIKYLRYLHNNISSDWTLVCGFYNTGYKQINEYAITATKYINNK